MNRTIATAAGMAVMLGAGLTNTTLATAPAQASVVQHSPHTTGDYQALCGPGYHQVAMASTARVRALVFRRGHTLCSFGISRMSNTYVTTGSYQAHQHGHWHTAGSRTNFATIAGPVRLTLPAGTRASFTGGAEPRTAHAGYSLVTVWVSA